jgi:serine protease Do
VALLKIQGDGTYPYIELGDSDLLKPGEQVLALGNPFLLGELNDFFRSVPADYHPTATLGVVSALHRNSPPRYPDAIQVDVAVNPGNSGGPLINLLGQAVGINGKIETRFHVSVNSGVGYAIPSRQIARFLGPLREAKGEVIGHGRILGVEVGERILEDGPGLPVKQIAGNSPAALAGLLDGDRILAIDEHPVPTRQRFDGILQTYPVGSRVRISVLRAGEVMEVLAALVDPDTGRPPRLGLFFDVDEETRRTLKVARVQPESPAQRAGIQVGDVLLRFDDQAVSSFIDLSTRIGARKVGDVAVIRVKRGGEELDIPVLLQAFDPK